MFQSGPPLPSLQLSNMSCQIKKDDIWALSSPLLHLYRPRWSRMWWFSLWLYIPMRVREGGKRLSGLIVDSNRLHTELLGKLPYLQEQSLQSFKFFLKFWKRRLSPVSSLQSRAYFSWDESQHLCVKSPWLPFQALEEGKDIRACHDGHPPR